MARHIAKALTWRMIGTAEVFAISYLTTGQFKSASSIAGLTALTSTLLYVVHEKIWHYAPFTFVPW